MEVCEADSELQRNVVFYFQKKRCRAWWEGKKKKLGEVRNSEKKLDREEDDTEREIKQNSFGQQTVKINVCH